MAWIRQQYAFTWFSWWGLADTVISIIAFFSVIVVEPDTELSLVVGRDMWYVQGTLPIHVNKIIKSFNSVKAIHKVLL